MMTASAPLDLAPMIEMLARLVAFDTQNPPGQEVEAARWLKATMAAMGFKADVSDVMPGRSNVVGILNNGPGPTFAFNTHIDVVPAGAGWVGDAFTLREEAGRLYGRGACDAKGPMVAMLDAMRWLADHTRLWSGTLLGVFVADEEVASRGAKLYAAAAPKIDYCLIGEPTSCTTYCAHKGSLRPLVRVHGRTAHSGMPERGVNAILQAAPLLGLVAAEHVRIKSRRHPLVGHPSLTVTRVTGGVADNVIPDRCELLLDRRMIPGEDEAMVKAELAQLVARASRQAGSAMEIAEFKATTGGATETAPDHPIVVACQTACQLHHGRPTPLSGFQGGCDLVHFRSIGAQGVVLGPGSLDVAHQPNEFVPTAELAMAAAIYREVAMTMLGEGRSPHLP
jgi:succinyl-diaminopimelate desuccinylase